MLSYLTGITSIKRCHLWCTRISRRPRHPSAPSTFALLPKTYWYSPILNRLLSSNLWADQVSNLWHIWTSSCSTTYAWHFSIDQVRTSLFRFQGPIIQSDLDLNRPKRAPVRLCRATIVIYNMNEATLSQRTPLASISQQVSRLLEPAAWFLPP